MRERAMPRYIVRVEGRNLQRRVAGESPRQGFTTARAVNADSAEDAGERVMNAIWEDETLRGQLLNDEDDPPLLYLSAVDVGGPDEEPSEQEQGYSFFEEAELDLSLLLGEDEDA
jgi:hypothetical protein